MLGTVGEVRMDSYATFSKGPLHMDVSMLANQQGLAYISCVRTLNILPATMHDRERWREREREREKERERKRGDSQGRPCDQLNTMMIYIYHEAEGVKNLESH